MPEKELNLAQKQAVEYTGGPLIIVAGAGTGKTTVITRKIRHLIDSGLAKPGEILALTFNEKAAAEIQERADESVPVGCLDMNISTFHAFCERLLEQYGLDIGLPNRFKIVTQTDAWLIIRKHLHKFNLNYYRPMGNPMRYAHEMIKHFSKCKDEMISPENYLDYAESVKLDKDEAQIEEKSRLTEIANAYHVYNRLLLDSNALDFGDLIYYANILLDKRPNILNNLQRKFKFILVDEFQDVNWAQYNLVRKLAEKGSQLTVVGDDDQSIYAFRGASVSNILRFKDDFHDAKEIVLNENYRSRQEILDKAYELIQNNNPDRLEIKLGINKKLVAGAKKSGGAIINSVIHAHHRSADDEVKFICEEIANIKEADKDAVWDDFAVLVRANSHADPVISALEKRGIPFEFMAAAGLFRQPVILDCFNFLKVIDNYRESPAIYRLLCLPFLGFKESDLQKLAYFADKQKSISYYEALKRTAEIGLSREGEAVAGKLVNLIHDGMKNARNDKPSLVLYKFLEASGYLKYLAAGDDRGDRSIVRQIHQLSQFLDYVANYEAMTPGAAVFDFVDHFNQVIDSGELGVLKQPLDTPDSVNVMTVHTAKGLEFKYVFIVNLVEERFPSRTKGEPIAIPDRLVKELLPEGDSHIEEERRLFYVAMTRARERLYLTSAADYGGVREKKLSRFLGEIGFGVAGAPAEKTAKLQKMRMPKAPSSPDLKKISAELPASFSFSQIQKYEKCPYQYKLAQILRLPVEGSPSLSFGLTMHNTLQRFYHLLKTLNDTKQESLFNTPSAINGGAAVKAPALGDLIKIYNECWISDWYKGEEQREEFFEKGTDALKEFYRENDGKWTVPVALETSFSVRIGQYLLRGRIDRVDRMGDGRLEIIDYKTGKGKEKIVGEDKEQLLIYQIALSQLPEFKAIGEPGQLTYYYINENERVSFLGTDNEIRKLEEKIDGIIDRIKTMDFGATPEKFTCAHCDFRDICDYRA